MTPAPQFVVTFRGTEIGRYETAERAMAAARSVIDTEVGVQHGRAELSPGAIPAELPRIEWQPPRVPFPFDGAGYWHWRAQSVAPERRPPTAPRPAPPPPPAPPAPPPPPAPEPVLPRGRDEPATWGPSTVYGGPVPQPASQQATTIVPVYGGPPQQPEPVDPPEPPEPGRKRWFGKGHD